MPVSSLLYLLFNIDSYLLLQSEARSNASYLFTCIAGSLEMSRS